MDPIPHWADGEDAAVVRGILADVIDRVNAYADGKADSDHGHAAAEIACTPVGNLAATDVDAALAELDGEKLAKAGGTMTGPLSLESDPTEDLHAASKGYVDGQFDGFSVEMGVISGLEAALGGKSAVGHTHTVPFYWLDFLNYDPTLGSNSSEEVPVVSAVKGYADGKLAKSGGTMTGPITLAADAASALQPVTKQQLEAALINMGKRQRVRAKTTANVNLGGGLVAGASVDGVTVALGDLVLVASQSSAAENGVYAVPTSGSAPRAAEFDSFDEHPGSIITVAEGSTQADTLWLCIANGGGTLGTTAIDWSPLRVSGELLAANNLSDLASVATALTNLGFSGYFQTLTGATDLAAMLALFGLGEGPHGIVDVGDGDLSSGNYTVLSANIHKVHIVSTTGTCTIVLPSGLTRGHSFLFVRAATSDVVLTAGGGATIQFQYAGDSKIARRYGHVAVDNYLSGNAWVVGEGTSA